MGFTYDLEIPASRRHQYFQLPSPQQKSPLGNFVDALFCQTQQENLMERRLDQQRGLHIFGMGHKSRHTTKGYCQNKDSS